MDRVSHIQTPTGPLAIIRTVAERLLKGGVISGSLDGVLHANDAATVKAAVMLHGVCDFCSSPGPEHIFEVPDFAMPDGTASTGGWAACGPCSEYVQKDDRKGLLKRALDSLAFAKFTRPAIEELHHGFWRAFEEVELSAKTIDEIMDFVEDRLPPQVKVTITNRERRIDAIQRVTGLTTREMALIQHYAEHPDTRVGRPDAPTEEWNKILTKVTKWRKTFGKTDAQALANLLDDGVRKPLPVIQPHWQTALDEKFNVAVRLQRYLSLPEKREFFPKGIDLNNKRDLRDIIDMAGARQEMRSMGFTEDLRLLPGAQVYSFNEETETAILEAAQSLPHDAPLSSIETPNTGCGWFWFSKPLDIAASPIVSSHTHALLWGWVNGKKLNKVEVPNEVFERLDPSLQAIVKSLETLEPPYAVSKPTMDQLSAALRAQGVTQRQFDSWTTKVEGPPVIMFSAYVRDDKGTIAPGELLPSTRWHWPLNMSFHDMLAYNRASWEDTYGEGTPLHNDPMIIGKNDTTKIVADLSLFFLMACLWFRQTVSTPPILTKEKGHIERHARKRYVREHKLTEEPIVQVVALRKSARTPSEEAPQERQAGAREYHCRWIVKGHPRMQAVGPGRLERKLIWIEAHPAGPEDKPFRNKTRVYAVVR